MVSSLQFHNCVGSPPSIVIPGTGGGLPLDGLSLVRQRSRDFHVAQPPDSLRSPFGPAFSCYFASLRFMTIPLGLLTGHCPRSTIWSQAAAQCALMTC